MVETDPQIHFPKDDFRHAAGHTAFADSETGETAGDTGVPMYYVGKSK